MEMARPQDEYNSRVWSTTMSMFQAPPSAFVQADVASGVQCETAMKWMPVCRFARVRMWRKSFWVTSFTVLATIAHFVF